MESEATIRATKKPFFRGDPYIWFIAVFLIFVSILAVYSSTSVIAYRYQGGDTAHYILRHMILLGVGALAMVGAYLVPSRIYYRMARIGILFCIGILAITLFLGVSENMATRRLILMADTTIQTSDMAKIFVVMYLSWGLRKYNQSLDKWSTVVHLFIFVGAAILLILPANFSTAGLVFLSSILLLFLGQVPLRHIFSIIGIAVGLCVVLICIGLFMNKHGYENSLTQRVGTWTARIERFLGMADTEQDDTSLTVDYQKRQALLAIGTGGILGKGPGNSTQRHVLPHPYSDFIYAIIIEEYGLVGGFLVMFCYIGLFYRVKKTVRNCERIFQTFLALGLGLNIILQAFVHMAVSVGLMPVTGQTLPFVSMGGSSLLFTGISWGIILRISRENQDRMEQEQLQTAALEKETTI